MAQSRLPAALRRPGCVLRRLASLTACFPAVDTGSDQVTGAGRVDYGAARTALCALLPARGSLPATSRSKGADSRCHCAGPDAVRHVRIVWSIARGRAL